MEGLPILEYGVAVASIGALVIVIRAFLKHLKCKDASFTSTINNHLSHDIEAKEKLIGSVDKLGEAIDRLEGKL